MFHRRRRRPSFGDLAKLELKGIDLYGFYHKVPNHNVMIWIDFLSLSCSLNY